MSPETFDLFWLFSLSVAILFVIGLYCLLATYNLIRALIGAEILIKAVTLLLVVVGYVSQQLALVQNLVITLIVIETVVMTVAIGVVVGVYRQNKSLNVTKLRNLKG